MTMVFKIAVTIMLRLSTSYLSSDDRFMSGESQLYTTFSDKQKAHYLTTLRQHINTAHHITTQNNPTQGKTTQCNTAQQGTLHQSAQHH